jgi:hypothetical protein
MKREFIDFLYKFVGIIKKKIEAKKVINATEKQVTGN